MVIRLNGTIQREDSLAIFLDWIEPWLTDKILQEACHKYNIEQEIYRTQKAHQNWIAWAIRTQNFSKWLPPFGKGTIIFSKCWMK